MNSEEFQQKYETLSCQLSQTASNRSTGTQGPANSDNQRDGALSENGQDPGSTVDSSPESQSKQLIEDEEARAGRVPWSDIMEFFSYAAGGFWGILLVFALQICINLCTTGVSLYLAFELTQRFSGEEQTDSKPLFNITSDA